MARPLYVRTFKEFFVSLRLPYSVQRGEQISVIATVFNYAEFNLKVKDKCLQTKRNEDPKLQEGLRNSFSNSRR